MRTALCLLFIPAVCVAEAPRDKNMLPKSYLEATLLKDRDAKLKAVQMEADSLERAIAEFQPVKPKRGAKFEVGRSFEAEVAGFKMPLSKTDLPKARTKLKELTAEIAKLKAQKPVVPEIEFRDLIPRLKEVADRTNEDWDRPFFSHLGICRLVELKSNTAGHNPAIPLFVTVEDLGGDLIWTKHASGQQIVITADASLYHVGQVITLDMPVLSRCANSDGHGKATLSIQLFEP